MKHKGVIFDLDGTLIDTLEDIAASMNRALEKHGLPLVKTEEYRDKVGWGIRRLAFLCLPEDIRNEERASLVADDAIQFYSAAPLVYTKPYPGILELVAQLPRKKIKTAVLTNKPDPTTQLVVAGLFPQGTFNIVQGEVRGRPRKPDPACVWDLLVELNLNPADVVFVGDSEVDIETAVTSGCFPLGVSWGYRSRDTILKAGARQIIDKPEELLELL
ncbi:MAG: HAD family hydrolase [Treponema sp.]|jgi:phosphoglycolate phosphatase|nr:HAD family hydrolase [Treponema sp.]